MEQARLETILHEARLQLPAGARVRIDGADPALAARYPIGEAAAVALAACAAQAAELWRLRGGGIAGRARRRTGGGGVATELRVSTR